VQIGDQLITNVVLRLKKDGLGFLGFVNFIFNEVFRFLHSSRIHSMLIYTGDEGLERAGHVCSDSTFEGKVKAGSDKAAGYVCEGVASG
jgi:hypothetical protein